MIQIISNYGFNSILNGFRRAGDQTQLPNSVISNVTSQNDVAIHLQSGNILAHLALGIN
jgi:hypothetical protein